jgi:hypothetical protein
VDPHIKWDWIVFTVCIVSHVATLFGPSIKQVRADFATLG